MYQPKRLRDGQYYSLSFYQDRSKFLSVDKQRNLVINRHICILEISEQKTFLKLDKVLKKLSDWWKIFQGKVLNNETKCFTKVATSKRDRNCKSDNNTKIK